MFSLPFARWTASALMLGAIVPAVLPAEAAQAKRCFDETGFCVEGRFRQYWEQNGGLEVFGFPIGPAANEVNRDTGKTYLTQWFERERMELHPENTAPYDVLLGRLGDDTLKLNGIDWQALPGDDGPQAGCLYFQQTDRNVCNQENNTSGFKYYWQTHGLEFDGKPGKSYQESLALFGLPLTQPILETNASGDTVLTQWFERARFEWHPNQERPYRVLLGLLGSDLRGPGTPFALNTGAPWLWNGQFLIEVDDAPRQMTLPLDGNGLPVRPVVSSDGKRLAYYRASNSGEGKIVITTLATGASRSTPVPVGGLIFDGVFSPDGTQFAFTAIEQGVQTTKSSLAIMNTETGAVRQVLQTTNNRSVVPVAWTTGGLFATMILYASDAPEQGMYLVNTTNGALQTIVDTNQYGSVPSPDGSKAALVEGEILLGDGANIGLSILNRSNGQRVVIAPQRKPQYVAQVAWSPNGAKLLHLRFSDNSPMPSSINVNNADGTGEQIIRLEGGPFAGPVLDVAWRGNNAVLILTPDGPNQHTLYEVSLSAFHPAQARTLGTFVKDGDFQPAIAYSPR